MLQQIINVTFWPVSLTFSVQLTFNNFWIMCFFVLNKHCSCVRSTETWTSNTNAWLNGLANALTFHWFTFCTIWRMIFQNPESPESRVHSAGFQILKVTILWIPDSITMGNTLCFSIPMTQECTFVIISQIVTHEWLTRIIPAFLVEFKIVVVLLSLELSW